MWWRSGIGLPYFPLFSAWGSLHFFFFANLTFDRVKRQRRNKRIVFSCSIHPSSFILCSLTSESVFPHWLKYAAPTVFWMSLVPFHFGGSHCVLRLDQRAQSSPAGFSKCWEYTAMALWHCTSTGEPRSWSRLGVGNVPGCNWGAGRGSARRYRVRPQFPVRMNSPSYL